MLSAEAEDWIRQRGWTIVASAAAAVGLWYASQWWHRPPAVEYDNLKYIQLLTTAVSARNADWLAKVEEAVEQRHESGEMSERELQAFQKIFSTVAVKEWKQAEVECYRLAQAQLSRRRAQPPASDGHDHEHDHKDHPSHTRSARLVAN